MRITPLQYRDCKGVKRIAYIYIYIYIYICMIKVAKWYAWSRYIANQKTVPGTCSFKKDLPIMFPFFSDFVRGFKKKLISIISTLSCKTHDIILIIFGHWDLELSPPVPEVSEMPLFQMISASRRHSPNIGKQFTALFHKTKTCPNTYSAFLDRLYTIALHADFLYFFSQMVQRSLLQH